MMPTLMTSDGTSSTAARVPRSARKPLRMLGRFVALGLALGASSAATSATFSTPAHAAIVERIVAVVGEKAILLTDLRERSLPILLRVHASIPAGPARWMTCTRAAASRSNEPTIASLMPAAPWLPPITNTVARSSSSPKLRLASSRNNLPPCDPRGKYWA